MSEQIVAKTPQFENLLNFRDVAASVNSFCQQNMLRPGLLFRSARPDETTGKDREQLVRRHGIKTIIDLRTTTEHINAAKKHSAIVALAQSAAAPIPEEVITRPLKIPHVRYAEINLNGKGFERSLIWQLRYSSLAKMMVLMVMGYRMEAISIIGREVLQPRGLIGLGLDTLEHSGSEIKEVFNVLADKDAWPVLVHCTQGKDRTGMVVTLVLLLCDIPIDAIVDDYVQSEVELEPEMEERMKEISSIGLSEEFAKCPREFAPTMRARLIEKHGGVECYLQGIGVSSEDMQRVKSSLQIAVTAQVDST